MKLPQKPTANSSKLEHDGRLNLLEPHQDGACTFCGHAFIEHPNRGFRIFIEDGWRAVNDAAAHTWRNGHEFITDHSSNPGQAPGDAKPREVDRGAHIRGDNQ